MPDKEAWTVGFVRRVLEAHNAAYHTNFTVCGRAESMYPCLHGETNWDWVCKESASGIEAAMEVKELTRQLPKQTYSELQKVAPKVNTEVRGQFQGLLTLSVDLPGPEFKVGGLAQRKNLVEHLARFVLENAKEVPDNKTKAAVVEAGDQLSEVLPPGTWLDLYRHDPAKLKPAARQLNHLAVNFGWGMFGATQILTGEELGEFRSLINKANQQLGVAKQKGIPETLLVLVEIGFSAASPDAVKDTLDWLAPSTCPNINHIYLVGYPRAQRVGGTANPSLARTLRYTACAGMTEGIGRKRLGTMAE